MKIEQQVIELWDQAMDEDLCDSENISFETFLGAQYARRVLSKQCKLTAEGKEVVEEAKLENGFKLGSLRYKDISLKKNCAIY